MTRAWLADYDVVFSAHVTLYGSIEARGRAHGAVAQDGVQETLRQRHRADEELDDFILRNIRDRARRTALIAEMSAQAIAAKAPHFRAVEG